MSRPQDILTKIFDKMEWILFFAFVVYLNRNIRLTVCAGGPTGHFQEGA